MGERSLTRAGCTTQADRLLAAIRANRMVFMVVLAMAVRGRRAGRLRELLADRAGIGRPCCPECCTP
ncbi:hypothetical protein GCM10011290_17090 [Vogesella alkaliphila]|uniref:Uncharacterized protein n=1 Tax=Vogesella alkaliphila TaxID=1193621 RepID=A0ABQ2YRH0_9NEIS|nr:hypothetical protein GCM10011290_17090 [Vogesella alkaliphila]